MKLFPERDPGGNKGTFGKVLFVTGSEGMCGAAYLSASAALRAGAGMVKIQTVEANRIPLQILLPEAMVCSRFDQESNEQLLSWCDVIVIGPGLGTSVASREREQWFLTAAAREKKPLILDADGLNAAAQLLAEGKTLPHPAGELIVTPHPGEMARLTGLSVAQINADRENTACQYAEKWNAVVVLKGCRTVVAAPDGRVCTNPTGNPGLARGGSGDVLAGMTAALLACGLPAYEAAACAVYLHGAAADRAAAALGEYGMLPHDILSQLGRIFAENHR